MRAYLALYVLVAVLCAAHADCDVCIDGQCYKKHSLSSLSSSETCLGMNRNSSTLYFDAKGSVKMCNLATMTCSSTGRMGRFRQVTVDPVTNDVYGTIGKNELYKLDLANSRKELLLEGRVWHIVYKDKLYYSKGYFGAGIYIYENGESRVVLGTEGSEAYGFGVSNEGDIYFESDRDVFKLSKGVVSNVNAPAGSRVSVDRDGNIVLIQPDSHEIYRVVNGQITEVGATKKATSRYFAPLFDNDNNLIVRYKTFKYFHVKKQRDVYCTTSEEEDATTVAETA